MSSETNNSSSELYLLPNRHAKFFQRTLAIVPGGFSSYDTQRVTIAFFAISGLDILDKLDLLADQKSDIIEWLYRCLLISEDEETMSWSGFRGSTALKLSEEPGPSHDHDHGHITMTYTALASLLILGDDLSRINRQALLTGVKALQLPNGSFKAALEGNEDDMRFLYCAACICYILDDWSGMDVDLTVQYIQDSVSYEGGVGQGPGLEAHGGSTYCAVAALSLMGRLQDLGEKTLERLTEWCIFRQAPGSGFMGRPNKPEDTCYSFWVGATLSLLDLLHMTDNDASRQFVLRTQDAVTGGLAKWVDSQPDPLHTYLGLSGLSLQGEQGLLPVDPGLNMSIRAKTWLKTIHSSW